MAFPGALPRRRRLARRVCVLHGNQPHFLRGLHASMRQPKYIHIAPCQALDLLLRHLKCPYGLLTRTATAAAYSGPYLRAERGGGPRHHHYIPHGVCACGAGGPSVAKKVRCTFSITAEIGKKSILDVSHLLPDALPRSVCLVVYIYVARSARVGATTGRGSGQLQQPYAHGAASLGDGVEGAPDAAQLAQRAAHSGAHLLLLTVGRCGQARSLLLSVCRR